MKHIYWMNTRYVATTTGSGTHTSPNLASDHNEHKTWLHCSAAIGRRRIASRRVEPHRRCHFSALNRQAGLAGRRRRTQTISVLPPHVPKIYALPLRTQTNPTLLTVATARRTVKQSWVRRLRSMRHPVVVWTSQAQQTGARMRPMAEAIVRWDAPRSAPWLPSL